MKILMLGWEFPPRRSGGLGTACQGIAEGLAGIGEEVVFLMPWEGGLGRVVAGPSTAPSPPTIPSPHPPGEDRGARAEVSPQLPKPFPPTFATGQYTPPGSAAQSLRWLRIASPLRPYLGADPVPGSHHASTHDPYGPGLFHEIERFSARAARASSTLEFDLLHAHDWMTLPAALRIQERRGRPLLWHVHSTEHDRRPGAPDPSIQAVEQMGLDRADRVIVVSRYTARTLAEAYRVDPAKLRVVHNAVRPFVASAQPDTIPAASGRSSTADRPLVLFLGRLTEQKGPRDFLAAAARVLERRPGVRFVLAGSGDLYPELVELAGTLGILPDVHFTGFLEGDDVQRMFAMADVYVMPSISEPFGISALEAMSAEVPAIVSARSGVSEVLPSAPTVEPGDVAGLAGLVLDLLGSPERRRELVTRGQREVEGLRWEERARSLRAIYRELAA